MVSRSLIYKYLTDIVMPNKCPVCERVLKWNGLLCEKCKDEFIPLKSEDNAAVLEGIKVWSLYSYEGRCVDMIYALKHTGEVRNFAEFSAVKLAEKIKLSDFADKIDTVTAVPMHWRKKAERGANQAELLAEFVADELHKPTDFRIIKHLDDNEEQHRLSAEERKSHAEKIYSANKKHTDVSGKTILICDDVITTGSTMKVCSEILRNMGAEVCCCSVAQSVKKHE